MFSAEADSCRGFFSYPRKPEVEEFMKKKSIVIVLLAVAIVAVLLLLFGRKDEVGSGPGMIQGAQVTVYSVVRRPLADRTEALGKIGRAHV